MKTFLTLIFLCHGASAVKHSLKYFLTGISGTTNSPEFAGIATIDEVEVGHCDSIIGKAEPIEDWARKVVNNNPQVLEWYAKECLVHQHFFKANMEVFKQRLNQTEGSHILQRLSGCEWDDESGEIEGFDQYGYDGEDFIALDMQALTWITPKAQAVVIKHLWDTEEARLDLVKTYYLSECPTFLKEYLPYGMSFLQRTERPSVSLLQKTPSSLVSCHATGFYPDRADLFWRKDGEEIHEGVEKGEILPNHDGTFQMNSELNVLLIKHEDWRRYECVFQLYGVKDDIITTLDKTEIQTNWVSPSEFLVSPAVGGAAGVVLLLVLSGFLYCCRRKGADFQPVRGDLGKEEES
ncbi:hypothetical protein OJAV_G00108990 [Oryzias javanicus]|uniref:Ig-like domain-containing protein n=1 Tax=Oryzias javanicus TaxID=123683 RepID=A0A3S2MGD5_ORYJA|nr:hypothetical protein OJAV_G00108990 [Oryzias javanicus]